MPRSDAILTRLLSLHPLLIDLGLTRIERLLDDLGRPQDRLPPVVHVAGTNGKGSTIALLRALLEAEGKSVHVYTSPHLVRFNERIRLAGTLVPERRLAAALEAVEVANGGQAITFFEITTAVALTLFAQTPADYLLLEVGLGGRFDATNVVTKKRGTVITPVSIDHVDYLGSDLAGIAREKAGILRRGVPAVLGRQDEVALEAILAEAERLGVRPMIAGHDFEGYVQHGRMVYQDDDGLMDLPLPALHGPFQIDNAATAIAASRHFRLGIGEEAVAEGLRSATWPGRLMRLDGALSALLPEGQELWLDGGHNTAGGAVLAAALRAMPDADRRKLVLIWGTFANKDARGYISHFGPLPRQVLTVPIPGERAAWKPAELAALAREAGLEARPMLSIRSALEAVRDIAGARIVICGSLHLAGLALKQNGTPPR